MLAPAESAPHLVLGPGARIGRGARFGAHVTVYPGTRIGADCAVEDGAVLGKPPRLARASRAPRGLVEPLVLEDGVTVGAGAVVLAGARLGAGASVGDQAYVRERVRIGAGAAIGRGSCVENDVGVGERVKVQSTAYLCAWSVVEDDVFIGPGVTTTNDDSMGRHGPGRLRGVLLRRASRIGGGSTLTPGVEVGEEAFVAAGAVVVRDVAPRSVVVGVPARAVRDVPDEDLIERWR